MLFLARTNVGLLLAQVGAACLLAASATALAGADTPPAPLPQTAEGEIPAVVDATLFLDPAARPEAYFCIAVPQHEVDCVEIPEQEGTRMELELRLTDLGADGRRLLERTQRLAVACIEEGADLDEDELGEQPALDRLIYLRAPWQTGTPAFELRIADLNSVRTGLVYQIRNENKRALVVARAPTADLQDSVGLSGCLFLWAFHPQAYAGQGNYWIAPAQGRRALLTPHPAHAYGLRNRAVAYYLEAYDLDRQAMLVTTSVTRRGQAAPLFLDTTRVVLPAKRSALARLLDVSRLAAGSYVLEVACIPAGQESTGGGEAAVGQAPGEGEEAAAPAVETRAFRVSAEFQMLWRAESWIFSDQALHEEAALFLDEEEMQRFAQAGAGEREVMTQGFWESVDGPMGSLDGPTRLLFRERVALADARFGGRVRGSLTDRGRVLVRFGEPDEVHKELLPLERDRIAFYLQREIDAGQRSDAGDPERRSPEDTSAYEVWTYMSWGHSLFAREGSLPTHGQPLRFIFVDELGTGQYELIYSNLKDDL